MPKCFMASHEHGLTMPLSSISDEGVHIMGVGGDGVGLAPRVFSKAQKAPILWDSGRGRHGLYRPQLEETLRGTGAKIDDHGGLPLFVGAGPAKWLKVEASFDDLGRGGGTPLRCVGYRATSAARLLSSGRRRCMGVGNLAAFSGVQSAHVAQPFLMSSRFSMNALVSLYTVSSSRSARTVFSLPGYGRDVLARSPCP